MRQPSGTLRLRGERDAAPEKAKKSFRTVEICPEEKESLFHFSSSALSVRLLPPPPLGSQSGQGSGLLSQSPPGPEGHTAGGKGDGGGVCSLAAELGNWEKANDASSCAQSLFLQVRRGGSGGGLNAAGQTHTSAALATTQQQQHTAGGLKVKQSGDARKRVA